MDLQLLPTELEKSPDIVVGPPLVKNKDQERVHSIKPGFGTSEPIIPPNDMQLLPAPTSKFQWLSELIGPSWLEQASAEHQKAAAAFQAGGPKALLALDPGPTFDLAGTFAGESAATADKVALAAAQKMLAKGANPKAIWDATGWFQGADGKWRFEIPDNDAFYLKRGETVGSRLYHPELLKAYPELENLLIEDDPFIGTGGSYRGGENPRIRMGREAAELTLLHEIQHMIQDKEGFAKGGSPNLAKPYVEQVLKEKGIKATKDKVNDYADKVYRLLMGEVEARNVEYRAKRSPEVNKQFPPWITEDRPREQQIEIGTLKLTPVAHDPFASQASAPPKGQTPSMPKVNLPEASQEDYEYGLKNLKFIPVDHDPFAEPKK